MTSAWKRRFSAVTPAGERGQVENHVLAWFKSDALTVRVELSPGMKDDPEEWGDNVILFIVKGRSRVAISLTHQTFEELVKLREVLDLAIDASLPGAHDRDEYVEEARQSYGYDHERAYRRVPQLVVRPGAFGQDGSGVPRGRKLLVRIPRNSTDSTRPGGDGGDEVAEREPDELGVEAKDHDT